MPDRYERSEFRAFATRHEDAVLGARVGHPQRDDRVESGHLRTPEELNAVLVEVGRHCVLSSRALSRSDSVVPDSSRYRKRRPRAASPNTNTQ
jgi:hypothetical protein